MRRVTAFLAIAVLVGAAIGAGCSDSSTPGKADSATGKSDGAASTDGQGGGGDTGTAGDTGSAGDTGTAGDTGSAADTGSAGDTGSAADTGARRDRGVAADAATGCKTDRDCKVFQDCCSCRGVPVGTNPPICKKACKQPTCDAWFGTPGAYCVAGRCKVGEATANSCTVPAGCKLVNDCCYCLAVPTRMSLPACGIKACLVSSCVSQGLGRAKADCVKGRCRLTAP